MYNIMTRLDMEKEPVKSHRRRLALFLEDSRRYRADQILDVFPEEGKVNDLISCYFFNIFIAYRFI